MAKREKVDSMKVVMELDAGKLHLRIRELREERKLSQNDLARKADMTVQNIQKIEQGYAKSIPYETLDAICKALDYPINKMMKTQPEVKAETIAA